MFVPIQTTRSTAALNRVQAKIRCRNPWKWSRPDLFSLNFVQQHHHRHETACSFNIYDLEQNPTEEKVFLWGQSKVGQYFLQLPGKKGWRRGQHIRRSLASFHAIFLAIFHAIFLAIFHADHGAKETHSETGRPLVSGFSLATGFILSTPPIRLQNSLSISFQSLLLKCSIVWYCSHSPCLFPCLPFKHKMLENVCLRKYNNGNKLGNIDNTYQKNSRIYVRK